MKYVGIMCGCVLCVPVNTIYIALPFIWLELCTTLVSGLLQNEYLTIGDNWKVTDVVTDVVRDVVTDAVTDDRLRFDKTYMFSPQG